MKISDIKKMYSMAEWTKNNLESRGCTSVSYNVIPDDSVINIHYIFVPDMPLKSIKVDAFVKKN